MKRIIVVGDIILDRYTSYSMKKMCPDRPIMAYTKSDRQEFPGGAANVAVNLAELCGPDAVVYLVGACSASTLRLIKQRSQSRINLESCIQIENEVIKERITLDDQMVCRLDSFDRYSRDLRWNIVDSFKKLLYRFQGEIDAVVLSDYNYGLAEQVGAALQEHPEIRSFIDTKQKDPRIFGSPFVLKLNEKEYSDIGMIEDRPVEMFAENCIVTRGDQGASLLRAQNQGRNRYMTVRQEFVLPPMDKAVDVSGCGDTFLAAVTFWIMCLSQDDVEGAIAFANLCASSVVHSYGTTCVSYEAVKDAIPEHRRRT